MRLAAPLLALAAGCATLPHESLRHVEESGLFRVHARDAATAQRVLGECLELAPRVLEHPAQGTASPVEIYCVPVDALYGEGRNRTQGEPEGRVLDCIEIEIGREHAWERFVIGHELAHAWLAPEWNPLPQILEEALADQCGARADPEAGACRRLYHGLRLVSWAGIGWPFTLERGGKPETGMVTLGHPSAQLPGVAGLLALDGTNYHDVGGEDEKALLYSVGYALAEQIGLEKLRALCTRALREGRTQIPAPWILEAAGAAPDADHLWGICGQRLLGEAEQKLLVQCLLGQSRFHLGDS